MFKVTVTPTVNLPPKRFWLVSLTTNQNLISTPHVITSLRGDPNTPQTVDIDFDIDDTQRRHGGVALKQQLAIVQVFMSQPEADLVYRSPKDEHEVHVSRVLKMRKYPTGSDEVLQVYNCKRFSLAKLYAAGEMTIKCNKRNEDGEYEKESAITIKFKNKSPRVLTDKELKDASEMERRLEIASPTRLTMLEESIGERLTLSSSKRLRKLEKQLKRPIFTESDVRQVQGTSLVPKPKGRPRRGNLVSFRTVAYLPKTKDQMTITNILKDYRDKAAKVAQQYFMPPPIVIKRPASRLKELDIIDMIFFDMNYFNENPVVCCVMDMGADTNELFWLNLLRATKRLEKLGKVKFDPDIGWVHMLSMLNAVGETYVLEQIDVYCEGWFSRSIDCDEAFQIVQLFQMFMRAVFKDNELTRLQKNASQYYPFCAFWYATTASAGDNVRANQGGKRDKSTQKPLVHFDTFKKEDGVFEVSNGDPIGHLSALFIKRDFFDKQVMDKTSLEPTNDNACILVGEGTSLMASKLDSEVPRTSHYMYADRLAQRSATSHKFYTRLMGIFTPVMLDKGLHAFLCYSKNAQILESGRCEIGMGINDLILHPHALGVVPYPKLEPDFIRICTVLADARTYCPDFLFEQTTDNAFVTGLKPIKTFCTTEDSDERYKEAVGILHDLFDKPASDRPKPVDRPPKFDDITLMNTSQPKMFGRGSLEEKNGNIVHKVFTVDDILHSEDALREMAREFLADFRIKQIDRCDIIQETTVMFVEFEHI